MHKKIMRIIALLFVLMLAASPMQALAEQPRKSPSWIWFLNYNRTPNDVRKQFNKLSNDWTAKRARKDWPEPPMLQDVTMQGSNFSFTSNAAADALQLADDMLFSITGQVGQTGTVDQLTVDIRQRDEFDRDYLLACDQLMQLSLFSLFDSLDDRTSRHISLQYIYDVRPFSFRNMESSLEDLARTSQMTVGDQLIELGCVSSSANEIELHIRFLGTATDADKERSADNNRCNRMLSQTMDECTDLQNRLLELVELIAMDEPNWENIRAISEQLDENTDALDELCFRLYSHNKALLFASRMHSDCEKFIELSDDFDVLIEQKSIPEMSALISSMREIVGNMRSLISLVQK